MSLLWCQALFWCWGCSEPDREKSWLENKWTGSDQWLLETAELSKLADLVNPGNSNVGARPNSLMYFCYHHDLTHPTPNLCYPHRETVGLIVLVLRDGMQWGTKAVVRGWKHTDASARHPHRPARDCETHRTCWKETCPLQIITLLLDIEALCTLRWWQIFKLWH